jgi:hypothetical protein
LQPGRTPHSWFIRRARHPFSQALAAEKVV